MVTGQMNCSTKEVEGWATGGGHGGGVPWHPYSRASCSVLTLQARCPCGSLQSQWWFHTVQSPGAWRGEMTANKKQRCRENLPRGSWELSVAASSFFFFLVEGIVSSRHVNMLQYSYYRGYKKLKIHFNRFLKKTLPWWWMPYLTFLLRLTHEETDSGTHHLSQLCLQQQTFLAVGSVKNSLSE